MEGDELRRANGRIQFNSHRPNQTLSYEDAAALLALLFERHRGTFGALLAEVVTGERFTTPKRKGVRGGDLQQEANRRRD